MGEIRDTNGSLILQNAEAEIVSILAQDLAMGYYAYASIISVAMDERSDQIIPKILPGQIVPTGFIKTKNPTNSGFHFTHFLNHARKDPFFLHQLERVYLSGALLTLADSLEKHNYFDRSPILELIRHLRHGISHGNRFRIDRPNILEKFPAHDRVPQNFNNTKFEITSDLNGTSVLFEFMEPGDLIHEFQQVAMHLMDLAYGVER